MPRIRNWKELIFYRPSKDAQYRHIDALFRDVIDWKLLETHWQDGGFCITPRKGKLARFSSTNSPRHVSQKVYLLRPYE